MAIKGLSIPVCGKYLNTGGTVTYSDAFVADHAVEHGVSWTTGDDNPFYAEIRKSKEASQKAMQKRCEIEIEKLFKG